MKILSIDWDYFFPLEHGYDWGHKESPLYIDIMWQTRVRNTNMFTDEPVLETYKPTVPENFWRIVTNKPKVLLLAESHCHMFDFINHLGRHDIVCLDAHHDLGYGPEDDDMSEIHAGNWVLAGRRFKRIRSYRLYYPEFRRDRKEVETSIKPTSVKYGLPKPAAYDGIFLCRSGAWTPPWYDDRFWQLAEDCPVDKSGVVRRPELKQRELTMEMALKARGRMNEVSGSRSLKTLSIPSSQFLTVKQEIVA